MTRVAHGKRHGESAIPICDLNINRKWELRKMTLSGECAAASLQHRHGCHRRPRPDENVNGRRLGRWLLVGPSLRVCPQGITYVVSRPTTPQPRLCLCMQSKAAACVSLCTPCFRMETPRSIERWPDILESCRSEIVCRCGIGTKSRTNPTIFVKFRKFWLSA